MASEKNYNQIYEDAKKMLPRLERDLQMKLAVYSKHLETVLKLSYSLQKTKLVLTLNIQYEKDQKPQIKDIELPFSDSTILNHVNVLNPFKDGSEISSLGKEEVSFWKRFIKKQVDDNGSVTANDVSELFDIKPEYKEVISNALFMELMRSMSKSGPEVEPLIEFMNSVRKDARAS